MTNLSGKSLENSNINEKISIHERALELDDKDLQALKALGFCYKDLGKFDLAVKYFSLAKKLVPFDRTLYYELGLSELARKNYIKAIKYFMNAIKLSPDYIEAIKAMALAHVEIEEFDMAEMIYLKILEKKPHDTDDYRCLGNLYIKTCDFKKALNCFRDMLAIDENNAEAYFGLARTLDIAQKHVEARRYYRKYLKLQPFSEYRKFVLEKLEKTKILKKMSVVNSAHLRLV